MSLPTNYRILEIQDSFEVREYDNLLAAKVTIPGTFETGYRKGREQLMSYFNGENYKKVKINYSPIYVLSSRVEGWEVSCILPKEFNVLGVPRPIGENIRFEEIKSRHVAVHRFKGKLSYYDLMKKTEELKSWAEEVNLVLSRFERIAVYRSSFFPLIRNNEIQIDRI
jgi:hypothetical protein